jgi:hypothetical protein
MCGVTGVGRIAFPSSLVGFQHRKREMLIPSPSSIGAEMLIHPGEADVDVVRNFPGRISVPRRASNGKKE